MDETRRATGAWAFSGPDGATTAGEGDLEVTDDGLAAGPEFVEHLDADSLVDADRTLTIGLWPAGRLTLSRLGRRHESFAVALAGARTRARVGGLLAHGVTEPVEFRGAVTEPPARRDAARFLVYKTHLTVAPAGADPFQVPFGAIASIRFDEPAWSVRVETVPGEAVSFGQLARQTEPFRLLIATSRDVQARRLAEATGERAFSDGLGVPAAKLSAFDRLLESLTAPEREACPSVILGHAERGAARLGVVELLDPDGESMAAKKPLPSNVAAFLLVPVRDRVVLEILSGPSAATYVFRGGIEEVNRDLQALHFRRRPLALTDTEASGEPGRPYRLALRRLEPLKRLRAATVARVVHNEGWEEALRRAVSPG